MAEAKPMQAWALEQQARAQQQQTRLQAMQMGAQAMSSALDMTAPRPTIHAPTHDWQESDNRAAHRALGLESAQNAHGYRMEERLQDESLDRGRLAWQMQMRAKYAPKHGGAGPVAKLVEEYHKTYLADQPSEEKAQAAQAKLRLIKTQLSRLPGGSRVVGDLESTGYTPEAYRTSGTKGQREMQKVQALEQGDTSRTEQTNKARVAAAKAAATQRADTAGQNLEVRRQGLLMKTDPTDVFADEDVLASKAAARKGLELFGATKVIGGKTYTRADDDGSWELAD